MIGSYSWGSGYQGGKYYAPGFYGAGFGYGARHFGDRSGYGYGHGHGYGHLGYGQWSGYPKQMYYGRYGSGFGLGGGYYNIIPSYHYGTMGGYYAAQPISTAGYVAQPISTAAYVAQPVVHSAGVIASDNVVRTAAIAPSVNFLTERKSDAHQEVVQAAVHQLGRTVEYKSMGHQEHPIQPQIVEVEPSETPLHLHFKTKSSSVSLSQAHEQAPVPQTQISQSSDEPARLIHEIQKPVIQEVREVITPYRQVTQEINPVVEGKN